MGVFGIYFPTPLAYAKVLIHIGRRGEYIVGNDKLLDLLSSAIEAASA